MKGDSVFLDEKQDADMDRILVNIYFPAVCRSYDMYIPAKCEISEISEMLRSVCGELTDYMFVPKDDMVLCDRKTGNVFDVNITPEELCLVNGTELVFI